MQKKKKPKPENIYSPYSQIKAGLCLNLHSCFEPDISPLTENIYLKKKILISSVFCTFYLATSRL